MSKLIRIGIVLLFMTAVIALGLNGVAWANRLGAGAGAPAAVSQDLVRGRGNGTVNTTPQCIQTLLAGRFTVGSIGDWVLDNVAGGKVYEACVVKPYQMPARLPGTPLTYPIELITHDSPTQNVPQRVCFPVPPGRVGDAVYWDGATWVKTEDAKDGQACATVPADVVSPTYVGLSEQP